MNKFRRIFNLIIIIMGFILFENLYAYDSNFGLSLVIDRYDNLNLLPAPVQEEWVEAIAATYSLNENTSNLYAKVDASIVAKNYRNNQQKDTTTNKLSANGVWIIKPRHFEWIISDIYTQTLINPLENETEINKQNINAFKTGPNYYWRLNARNNIKLQVRGENISYENNIGDNNRLNSTVSWINKINSLLTGSLNASTRRIDYVDNINNDYTINDLFLGANYKTGRNVFDLRVGTTNIDYDTGKDIDGEKYNISWKSKRTRLSNLNISYDKEITDTGTEIFISNDDPDIPDTFIGTDSYIKEKININYNKQFTNGVLKLKGFSEERLYDIQSDLNYDKNNVTLSLSFSLSGASTFLIESNQSQTEYFNLSPVRVDDFTKYKLSYLYKARKNVNLNFLVENKVQTSTDISKSYEDNRISVSIQYKSR